MQRYINDEWWIASYAKPDIGENKIKGKYIDLVENGFFTLMLIINLKLRIKKQYLFMSTQNILFLIKKGIKSKKMFLNGVRLNYLNVRLAILRKQKNFLINQNILRKG